MAESTTSTLNGYFKEVFGPKLENLVPSFSEVAQDIPFDQDNKIGEKYTFPVRTSRAMGWTFAGSSTAGTAYTLNDAIPGITREASAEGTSFTLREQIATAVCTRAASSKQAFGKAFSDIVTDMRDSGSFARELCLLYGGSDIGVVSADPGVSTTGSLTFVLTAASWATGLWAQMENALVDVYETTLVTKRNTVGDLQVTAIDPDTRSVTLTGADADLTAITTGDRIVPKGANGNWFNGLRVICGNTSVSIHGINPATYHLWRGNAYALNGAATFAKIISAGARSVVRGGLGERICYLSPFVWTDLADDAADLRRFADSTKGGLDVGTTEITYYGVNGMIRLKPHPMVKTGDGFMISKRALKRVGSTDMTFDQAGADGKAAGEFFRKLDGKQGFELQLFWDQVLCVKKPSDLVYLSGITSTSAP